MAGVSPPLRRLTATWDSINDAFFQSMKVWDRDRQALISVCIVGEAIRESSVALLIHYIPASNQIGTFVVETHIHEIHVPFGKGTLRDGPFQQRLPAMRTPEGVLYSRLSPL